MANGIGRSVILWYQEHPGTKCQASNCLDQMSPLEPSHGLLNKPPWSRLNKAASTSVIPWPGHAIDEFLHGHCEEKADCCLGSTAQHKNRGERSVKKCKDISDIKIKKTKGCGIMWYPTSRQCSDDSCAPLNSTEPSPRHQRESPR